jgi:hypothetical protein
MDSEIRFPAETFERSEHRPKATAERYFEMLQCSSPDAVIAPMCSIIGSQRPDTRSVQPFVAGLLPAISIFPSA